MITASTHAASLFSEPGSMIVLKVFGPKAQHLVHWMPVNDVQAGGEFTDESDPGFVRVFCGGNFFWAQSLKKGLSDFLVEAI